ncbi:MAG TPA: anti-sigma factor [Terriglobales bacterium]|jgi:anti-sigma-K factor RskA
MSVHEQFAEDLALHALEALTGEQRESLERHLHDCADCRRELEKLRGDMALLGLSASGPRPPERSRQRLTDAIARERRQTVAAPTRGWWMAVPWVVAAVLAVAVAFLWRENQEQERSLAGLKSEFQQQRIELERARQIVSTLTATDALRVTLVAAKTPPQPQGKAIYVRERANLIFLASNMPQLPAQKAYELWIIPQAGAPIPAGVFKPDVHGSATVVNPPIPSGVQAKAFAITVEPEAGSPAPTSEPIMLGAGE